MRCFQIHWRHHLDSANDYYNFTHPHVLCAPDAYKHRLGNFQTCGTGRSTGPRLAVLHVPVYEAIVGPGKDDPTAEIVAKYLADPPENRLDAAKYGRRYASVHATCDSDSYVLCLPADGKCWGCGNWITAEDSWEIEIGGMGTEPPDYWNGEIGKAKLTQAARAHIKSIWLVYGDDWINKIVPPQKARIDATGRFVSAGWLQHRDVPYWTGSAWAQPPEDNIKAGQHADIHKDFPMETFFMVLAAEVNRSVKEGVK